MFGHTALAGNFLILIALCIWAYREKYKDNVKLKIILWTLILVLSASIHMYYVPMVVIIMISSFIVEFIENRKSLKWSIITFGISCIITLMVLYILGGFTNSTFESGGIDYFNANLDTFINPQGYSRFLSNLKTATDGEYEGVGYLGLGILLMCFFSICLVIQNYGKKDIIKILKNPNTIFVILCVGLGMLIAIGTSVKFGSHVLFHIPYPKIILKVLSAFRSSGRFVWLPCYIMFFASMYLVYKNTNKKCAISVISICLVIQLLDLYPSIKTKFTYEEKGYNSEKQLWTQVLEDCEHIVCLPIAKFQNGHFLHLGYIARENGCTMNNFYFARKIKNVEETNYAYMEELKNGDLREGFAYVLKNDDVDIAKTAGLDYTPIDEFIVIKKK